ncbi:MAG: DNA methyltransferase [Thermodesulfobacteriota bacterium]|nr:DNA methyltransferase [Thermodesulfobacteriota bacterium]
MSEIVWVETERLKEHPKNPRIVTREDVIKGIMAGIDTGFHPSHALKVWPDGDGFVVVAGHHRLEAAKRKGIDKLPCWIRDDLDEDGAFMLLATDNNQGELSPLEIGMHALNYVEASNGGRGQKGGLSEYARKIGKNRGNLVSYSNAAAVANLFNDKQVLLDKSAHLAAIHQLPKPTWQPAVDLMLKKEWSAKETQEQVKAAKEGRTDKQVGALFLGKVSRRELDRVADMRDKVFSSLSYEDLQNKWLEWFDGTDPISAREVQIKRIEFEDIEAERRAEEEAEQAEETGPVLDIMSYSDWLPLQEQCDLLLTDPPYSTDIEDVHAFASEWLPLALSKVKPTGRAYIFIGAYPNELQAYLSVKMPTQILVWTYRNTLGPSPSKDYKTNWQAILYYRMDDAQALDCPVMNEQFSVQDIAAPDGRHGNRYHEWQKPDELAERIIRHSTKQGDLILDPFCCTGTFILAAHKLNRTGIGCDISTESAEIAKDRGCRIKR